MEVWVEADRHKMSRREKMDGGFIYGRRPGYTWSMRVCHVVRNKACFFLLYTRVGTWVLPGLDGLLIFNRRIIVEAVV